MHWRAYILPAHIYVVWSVEDIPALRLLFQGSILLTGPLGTEHGAGQFLRAARTHLCWGPVSCVGCISCPRIVVLGRRKHALESLTASAHDMALFPAQRCSWEVCGSCAMVCSRGVAGRLLGSFDTGLDVSPVGECALMLVSFSSSSGQTGAHGL